MVKIQLKAQKRKLTGRKVKSLRREGVIPANIFGKGVKSKSIQVDRKDFLATFAKAGETGVIELTIGGEREPVLVANVQMHPVTDTPLHVDFRQVNLKEKVTATVPVEIVGESPAEKSGLGTAVEMIDEIEVEALPTDLPDKFEVDISTLAEVDQAIYVKDLTVNREKVTVKADPELIVVKVEPPQKEEEIVPPAPEGGVPAGEAPAEGEKGAEEAQKPEGEAAPETSSANEGKPA